MIYSTSQCMMTLLREGRAHSTNPARANMAGRPMNDRFQGPAVALALARLELTPHRAPPHAPAPAVGAVGAEELLKVTPEFVGQRVYLECSWINAGMIHFTGI
jgi:hypothetical protein